MHIVHWPIYNSNILPFVRLSMKTMIVIFLFRKISISLNSYFLFEGIVKEKWKGYRMKSENLRSWTIHLKYLSDVHVSRNWYKTVSNFRLVTLFPSVSSYNYTAMPLAEVLVTYYGLYVIILSIISIFVKFDTVLYQFLETGTSDRYVLYRYRSFLEIFRN